MEYNDEIHKSNKTEPGDVTAILKQQLGEDIFNSFLKLVKDIETQPPTTKNHYGDYMSALSKFQKKEEREQMALFLIFLGANKDGVIDAMKILGGSTQ